MNSPSVSYQYLAPSPKSAYKQLFVKGTCIRAEVVYGMTVDGSEPMTPEQAAADFNLPIEAVREAISYCESQPAAIEEDHRAEQTLMEATGMNEPDYKYGGKYKIISPEERGRLGV